MLLPFFNVMLSYVSPEDLISSIITILYIPQIVNGGIKWGPKPPMWRE